MGRLRPCGSLAGQGQGSEALRPSMGLDITGHRILSTALQETIGTAHVQRRSLGLGASNHSPRTAWVAELRDGLLYSLIPPSSHESHMRRRGKGASLSSASPALTGNHSQATTDSKTRGRGTGSEGGSAGREGEVFRGLAKEEVPTCKASPPPSIQMGRLRPRGVSGLLKASGQGGGRAGRRPRGC